MKKIYYAFFLLIAILSACKKDQITIENKTQISNDIIQKLKTAGFDTSEGFSKYKNGYLVEGDIFMTEDDVNNLSNKSRVSLPITLDIKNNILQSKDPLSHYRANNIINLNSSRRTINIYIEPGFTTYIENSLDAALARYNDLDLSLNFNRISSSVGADIVISAVYISPVTNPNQDYLMAAGFPTSGNPYNQINVNTYYYNSGYNRLDATSSFVHEIGHTIGIRHTDYMNRAFSCGAVKPGNNEGASSIGAVHIPFTPTGESYNSVMLACSDGSDRVFTESDIIALKGTYWYRKNIYVKPVETLISNESYYTTYNDYVKVTYDISAEFYQDAALTIPYTTANHFMLYLYNDNEFTHHTNVVLVPNGVTSFNIGPYVQEKEYNFGTLISDNTTGYRSEYGVGYYLFPHYEY